MTKKFANLAAMLLILITSCTKMGELATSPSSPLTAGGQGSSGSLNQPGVITAGEWNDLDNWSFWQKIMSKDSIKSMPSYWSFFNNHRIAVHIVGTDAKPVIDALVTLKRNGTPIFSARTDNKGDAELWADIYQYAATIDISKLAIDINNGATVISNVKAYKQGINNVVLSPKAVDNKIDISFVVDATGSMSDELEYFKTELLDVISSVKSTNPNAVLSTSSVFYRDEGDSYVTRVSDFTNDNSLTTNFIKNQYADGGGDFPEAVHTALDKAVNELKWSANARTRLLFLVLDAPPHYDNAVLRNLQVSVIKAAEKGIKIIPITASGIDKETEFLMRFLAITTNGTYVFITDHSGIGSTHLEPTVGKYEVEFLNDLLVRLINKYAE